MKKIIWIILGLLIATGITVTIFDYKNWRQTELANYGQGWNDLKAPALELTTMYQNNPAGIRIRIPDNWKITERAPFLNPIIYKGTTPITSQPQEVINIREIMTVKISYSDKSLTDIVTDEVKRITVEGGRLSRDWEYANSDKINMTVITRQEEISGGKTEVLQEAMAKKGNKLLEIDVKVPFENWGNYENTILEIYKNTEIL
jgi:hypothetical protein